MCHYLAKHLIDGKLPPHTYNDFGDECPASGRRPMSFDRWASTPSKPIGEDKSHRNMRRKKT